MYKSARAKDPNQDKLRQDKKSLNPEIKLFIKDLINFKKLLNGAPSEFHNEKSRITDPIPMDPNQIINDLASDFGKIYQSSKSIIEEQKRYSEGFNARKQEFHPKAANEEYNLIVNSSNKVTRFLSNFRFPWFNFSDSSKAKGYRIFLLNKSAELDKQLSNLEHDILGSGNESIFAAIKLLYAAAENFVFIKKQTETIKEKFFPKIEAPKEEPKKEDDKSKAPAEAPIPAEVPVPAETPANSKNEGKESLKVPSVKNTIAPEAIPDTLKKETVPEVEKKKTEKKDKTKKVQTIIAPDKPPVEETIMVDSTDILFASVKSKMEDLGKTHLSVKNINKDMVTTITSMYADFIKCKDKEDKEDYAERLIKMYNALLTQVNKANGTSSKSFEEFVKSVNTKKAEYLDNMEKFGQSKLSKMLRNLRHRLSLTDDTSAIRLDIYEKVKSLRGLVNDLMDLLEKDLDILALENLFKEIEDTFGDVFKILKPLDHLNKGKNFSDKFIEMLRDNSLNYKPNLTDKQEERLERRLNEKQILDVTKGYFNR